MLEPAVPSTLFGIPFVVRRTDAQQLVGALSELWAWQMRRPPSTIDADLDALRCFFDPLATGRRLRNLLADLPPIPPVRARLLAQPAVLPYRDKMLITLEGRVILDVLDAALHLTDGNSMVIEPDVVCAAEHMVYERYRKWGIRRIQSVLALLSGNAEALRLPSIGLLLLLLVNGSRSPTTALPRLLDPTRKRRVDEALSAVVSAFCEALDDRERDTRHYSLYSGYVLTEALRRLPGTLVSGREGIYIVPDAEDLVLSLISTELRRPLRSFPTADVMDAFDQLVGAYRSALPSLAALNIAFEQRAETRRVRQRLEEKLGDDASDS
jgi:hypothetical protein